MHEDLGNITRLQLDQMINQFKGMEVAMPLIWLYVWDVVKESYEDLSWGYTKANPDKNLDDVWNELWSNPVFSLEYGTEQLYEHVRDWLIDHDFILGVDGESEDMIESTREEETTNA